MEFPGIEGYTLQSVIGQGATGTVYRAQRDDGIRCAVKVLNSMAVNRDVINFSFQRIGEVARPEEILTIYEYDIVGAPLFVSMPLMADELEDGSVQVHDALSLCGSLSDDEAWGFLGALARGVAFLHKQGVVHCSLKPTNVFYEQVDGVKCPRIADIALGWLGGVHRLDLEPLLPYMAPEQLGEPDQVFDGAGLRWDVYAFGVVAYQLVTGRLPRCDGYVDQARAAHDPGGVGIPLSVDTDDFFEVLQSQGEIEWPTAPASDGDLARREVIERCLRIDPSERWIDLREVDEQFVAIDAAIESARMAMVLDKQRRRERKKLKSSRGLAAAAGVGLLGACVYGLVKRDALGKSEQKRAEDVANLESDIGTRDTEIVALKSKVANAVADRSEALASYRIARNQTDELLGAILDPESGDASILSDQQLAESLAFYEDRREKYVASPKPSEASIYDHFNLALLRTRTENGDGALEAFRAAQEQWRTLDDSELELEPDARAACLSRVARSGYREYRILSERGDDDGSLAALRKSNEAFAELLIEGVRDPDILSQYASVNLRLGRMYRELGRYQDAANAQAQVGRILSDSLDGDSFGASDRSTLVQSQHELGLIRRLQGSRDAALQLQLSVVESILPLLEVDVATTEDERVLALAYTELGEIVTEAVGPAEGLVAHSQAVALLKDILSRHPGDGQARYCLARNYGQLAAYDRDAGQAGEARKKQEIGIGLLEGLISEVPDTASPPPAFLLECARQKTALADLLSDSDETLAAIGAGDESLGILNRLAENLTKHPLEVQRGISHARARVLGILGHNNEKAGDKSSARAHFTQAVSQWKSLAATDDEAEVPVRSPEEIRQGLEWSQDRLAKLSP